MVARNDITGDSISSKGSNDAYRTGWDRIFNKQEVIETESQVVIEEQDSVKTEDICAMPGKTENDLRKEWWKYCEDNQVSFTTPLPSGNLVPSFDEWCQMMDKNVTNE